MTWQSRATARRGAAPLGANATRAVDDETLATYLDADRTGPTATVLGLAPLHDATEDDLAFCKYDDPDPIRASDAGIVVCPPGVGRLPGRTLVHSDDPRTDFVRATHEFFMAERAETVVHPSAVVEPGATIGEGCFVGAQAYVADCVTVGDRCAVGHGSVLGSDGFGFARMRDGELKRVAHTGTVVLEDDVEVGANCTIDRAVFDRTVVGRGTKLSGNVHLAHQVELGEDVTVAYGCGFAGGSNVGDRTVVNPNVSVATDVTVGPNAELGMNAAVLDDVPAGTTVVGAPARPTGGSS